MEIKVEHGKIKDIDADILVIGTFEDDKKFTGSVDQIDIALDREISTLLEMGDINGELDEITVIYTFGKIKAKRIIVVGLGMKDAFDLEGVRVAAANAIKKSRNLKAETIAISLFSEIESVIPISFNAQATIEGAMLALYKYRVFSDEEQNDTIKRLIIVESDKNKIEDIERGISRAEALVNGVYLTRDLVNMPPNIATPNKMAETAEAIAERYGMGLFIGDRDWAKQNEMGAYLSVAKGAGEEPRFVVLEHNIDNIDMDTIVLVGKGITFDSGGISLKPGERMANMKSDMAGAGVVLGVMEVVGKLNIPLRVIGIAPCTENMPDAYATRPADVVRASNGKTIEIINTDAEGRMILADALVYATRYQPDAVIDLATLTGACVVALGQGITAGLFTTSEQLSEKLVISGKNTNERVWPMPLWDVYKQAMKSNIADIKNIGGRYGGVGTSAIFLKQFIDYTWAHLDIAGMALSSEEKAYKPKGATGFGVRLLADLLLNW